MVKSGGVGMVIVYVMIVVIIAILSLIYILHMFVAYAPENKISVEIYLGNERISEIHCTMIDNKNYAYYDYENNPDHLDILVKKNGKPAANMYITLSGCGITQESSKTNVEGHASLSLVGVYLPPGIDRDKMEISVMGEQFYIDVVRG